MKKPHITRVPAIPLVVNDPYLSIWCPADTLTGADTAHWAGEVKKMRGTAEIDGKSYRYLGLGDECEMETYELRINPTSTVSVFRAAGVELTVRFTTPLLLNDPDALSTPITFIDFSAASIDGNKHGVSISLDVDDGLCYDGAERPAMIFDQYRAAGLDIAYTGQLVQKPLSHSGDHITIDWGYAYLAADRGVQAFDGGLTATACGETPFTYNVMLGYDDIASINYFGKICPAWYARNGKTFPEALTEFGGRHDQLMAACRKLDDELAVAAWEMGGEDYELIISAAYRQSVGAHKLIADGQGDMVFLSKENDSNGCIGTVDLSYPSSPLYLLLCPEYVRAMCRPILKFAELPVWSFDFAPHDVGRYPYATGQVYGAIAREHYSMNGNVYPPYYLYPAGKAAYKLAMQMPVEECGNMLIMLAAAFRADGNMDLIRRHLPLLEKWAGYLVEYGEDPGEQLCTDDFAGHLAHNVNLSAKALCGVAAYSIILSAVGEREAAAGYMDRARAMAKSWLERASTGADGTTSLTFGGEGWSIKYNMVWDKLLGLGLLKDSFYLTETKSYIGRRNRYGVPLDSRADYTKSDWILWAAAMAWGDDFHDLIKPVADFLRESEPRVAFSDWYDTKTGIYEHFIARSVQGGVFMPLLMRKWTEEYPSGQLGIGKNV